VAWIKTTWKRFFFRDLKQRSPMNVIISEVHAASNFRLKSKPIKKQARSNRLHGVMPQKIELFTTTAVRASNPTIQGTFTSRPIY
jgi:hypothetical protein